MTFDMKELDYIFPIFGHSADVIGQGFVADGFFITAAHVLTVDLAAYIVFQGKTISLAKETPIVKRYPPIENNIVNLDRNSPPDVAVFNFKGVNSPLRLSDYSPKEGEEVASLCVFENTNNGLFAVTSGEEENEFVLSEIKGTIMPDRMGNYFGCIINRRSTSSGSPLIIGNNVVGIMNSGHDNDVCVYLSAKSIINLLNSERHEISNSL